MNDNDLEKRLSALKLARASDDYLDKGLSLANANSLPPGGFWQRRPSWVLTSALVLSVSANVFQLVSSASDGAQAAGQLAQCNTPAAAASPAVENARVDIATRATALQPLGMC